MRLRVLIVDDEPLARDVLRHWLAERADVEAVAECGSGADALALLQRQIIDLMFLDIQMPEMDGFALLEQLQPEHTPIIVFVTAHRQYALRAFEAQALDYLVKPFDKQRFDRAFERAARIIEQSRAGDFARKLEALLSSIRSGSVEPLDVPKESPVPKKPSRLTVYEKGKFVFVPIQELTWLEAEGDYVRLHTTARRYLIHDTLAGVEAQLDPDQFLRIHRSLIVNVEQVREMEPYFNGEYHILMQDGSRLKSSRTYNKRLLAAMGHGVSKQH